jgi:hypothetical protein
MELKSPVDFAPFHSDQSKAEKTYEKIVRVIKSVIYFHLRAVMVACFVTTDI